MQIINTMTSSSLNSHAGVKIRAVQSSIHLSSSHERGTALNDRNLLRSSSERMYCIPQEVDQEQRALPKRAET